jgi:hypothetical protein
LIFTVPSELNPYWRYNKRLFARLLFRAVHDTLVELLGDARYLGAVARMLAALHTWSQQLADHPHVHVLVTAGGLSVAEAWRQPLKSCLIPRRVVMQLNSRLVAYRDGQVSFRYRDNREADAASGRGRSKVMTLAAPDFMRRVLEHVPPPGMHTVWSWGL